MQSLARRLGGLNPHEIFAIALTAAIGAWALFWPVVDYDNWMYHLPFSAWLWGLTDIGDFRAGDFLEQRWQGFPKAWHWIQGLFWAASGSIRAMIVPQLALWAAWVWVVSRKLQLSAPFLILGFFASPMLLVHFQYLYLDLPAGLLLALGFFLLMHAIHRDGGRLPREALWAVLLLGLAGNVKVQAQIAVLLIAAVTVVVALCAFGWSRLSAKAAGLAMAAAALASVTSLANLQRTGNPLYPQEVKLGGALLFAGPEDPMADARPPLYEVSGRMVGMPQPVAFALSVTELDWTVRGVPPRYNVDSNNGDAPLNGARSRTGGWGWLFVLANGVLVLLQLLRIRSEGDALQRRMLLAAVALVVATAILPRSHELRYWLFLPLILMPLNLRYLSRLVEAKLLGLLLALAVAYALAQTILTPGSLVIFNRPPLPGMAGFAPPPPQLVAALRERGRYCDEDPILFRHSRAVTGVGGMLSQRLEDCRPPAAGKAAAPPRN